ncbi:MAG TPA: hypothetical protein VHT34_14625, partial [Clostridia bacterium]|nr:hypothetical protein [Clostridia bacterium]
SMNTLETLPPTLISSPNKKLFLLYYTIDNSVKNMSNPSGNTITELASKVRNNFLFGEDIRVGGNVSNVFMLPLKSTIKKYSEEDEAEVSPLYDYEINDAASGFEGYIYIGKIAKKEYIIAAAPKNFINGKSHDSLIKSTGSIKRILSSNAITFKGTLKYIDSSNILNAVKSTLNSNGISIDNLVTDKYIVLDKPIKKNKAWEFILFCFVYPLAAFSIVVILVLWDWYKKYSFKDVV